MTFLKTTTLFVTLVIFITSHQAHAQSNPQDFVSAHNKVRFGLGLPPVTWNNTVAAYAKQYAAKRGVDCKMEHSEGPFGENLAEASWDLSAAEAVKMWADEGQDYDHKSNSCAKDKVCGHYTQIVWRDSIHIGCAKVKCQNKDWTFITCNYDPPGNYEGESPY